MNEAPAQRKIVKARKQATVATADEKLYDEDGNEIEFEGEVERDEDYVEEEVV